MFAPAGECTKRERLITGEVWDENAWVMGGVAGHAGLFGTASAIHAWAAELLEGDLGRSLIFDKRAIRAFWSPDTPGLKGGWKLGFEPASREAGFVDFKSAPDALTLAGNTGSSIFIDPSRELIAVLLTNAGFASGHPTKKFLALRSEIHSTLLEAL
jgi:CubicO group peptidase (beta-lactamase class C family)